MIKIICENEYGDKINFSHEDKYIITNVAGLNPPSANIVTYEIPNSDGGLFRSSKANTRNIVLTFAVKKHVETNRLDAYKVFRSKHYIKVYIKTTSLDVFTEGYVESVECNNFTNKQTIQVSIICPNPFFINNSTVVTNFNKVVSTLYFPFATVEGEPVPFNTVEGYSSDGIVNIYNRGDVSTGIDIIIKPKGDYWVKEIMLQNTKTGEYIFVSRPLSARLGEYLTIKTNKGEKEIFTTYKDPNTHQNVKINVIDACIVNKWLELDTFDNNFRLTLGILPEGYVRTSTGAEGEKVIPEGYVEYSEYYLTTNYTNYFTNIEMTIRFNEKWQGV